MGEAITINSIIGNEVKAYTKLFSSNAIQRQISSGQYVPVSFEYYAILNGAFLYYFHIPELTITSVNTGYNADYPAKIVSTIITSYTTTGLSNREGFVVSSDPSSISVSDTALVNPAYGYELYLPPFDCALPSNRFNYVTFNYTRNFSSLLLSYPKIDVSVTAYYIE